MLETWICGLEFDGITLLYPRELHGVVFAARFAQGRNGTRLDLPIIEHYVMILCRIR
jgi:hypothetical protein